MGDQPRILIAVKTCHKYTARADAQRRTWVSLVHDMDLRFFLGRRPCTMAKATPAPDEVWVDADDGYQSLPAKVLKVYEWALDQGYDWAFMADDDTYVVPDRLLAALPGTQQHYVGRLRGPSGGYPACYCSGFGYWVSRMAMEAIVINRLGATDTADDRAVGNTLQRAGIKGLLDDRYRVARCDEARTAGSKGDVNEDRVAGNALLRAGIRGTPDYRYAVERSKRCAVSAWEGPRLGNDLIATCEYEPADMDRVHQEWLHSPSSFMAKKLPEGPLSRVCVLIKTFLRDGYLVKCLESIRHSLPEVKIIVVDDGFESKHKITLYAKLRQEGHDCLWLPFDSGFGAKSNAAISHFDREFVLIGCDDFSFRDARPGIEAMVRVMDQKPKFGLVSGRVNGNPYECDLVRQGSIIREVPPKAPAQSLVDGTGFQLCDLTVNYSLIRTRVFRERGLHWCPEWKIGADHWAFFDAFNRTNWQVACVPSAHVRVMRGLTDWQSPRYQEFRSRAVRSLPSMFKRFGIVEYRSMAGAKEAIDYPAGVFRFFAPGQGLYRELNFTEEDLRTRCSHCGRESQ